MLQKLLKNNEANLNEKEQRQQTKNFFSVILQFIKIALPLCPAFKKAEKKLTEVL